MRKPHWLLLLSFIGLLPQLSLANSNAKQSLAKITHQLQALRDNQSKDRANTKHQPDGRIDHSFYHALTSCMCQMRTRRLHQTNAVSQRNTDQEDDGQLASIMAVKMYFRQQIT